MAERLIPAIRADRDILAIRRRWDRGVSERDATLLARWMAGEPLDDIADALDVNATWVQQLAQKYGLVRFRRVDRKYRPARVRNHPDFWDNVVKGDGCWEWQGVKRARYGTFRGRPAHRLALEEAIGRTLTGDEMACHHCDNPPCVRPDHLYVGDAKTNGRDYAERGKGRRR